MEVHCLHIWSLNLNLTAIEAKIIITNEKSEKEILSEIHSILETEFNCSHLNIEIIKKNFSIFKQCS